MIECPHCKSKKGWPRLISREWEKPKRKQAICSTCEGKGTISEIEMAIYTARGGPAPIKFRGYA